MALSGSRPGRMPLRGKPPSGREMARGLIYVASNADASSSSDRVPLVYMRFPGWPIEFAALLAMLFSSAAVVPSHGRLAGRLVKDLVLPVFAPPSAPPE